MSKYTVKERGANGSIEVQRDRIIRTFNKRLRRDERDVIPMSRVTSVDHDSQIGGDVVTVKTKDTTFEWKIDGDENAKRMTEEIRAFAKR